MGYSIKDNLGIAIGYRDTFCIPFAIQNHPMLEHESFLFTVRRIVEGPGRKGRPPETGGIVFQKRIAFSDVTPVTDDEGDVVGCEFFVIATKNDSELIPEGRCTYDLALVNNSVGFEMEVIPPSPFYVGEVLRYD